MIYKLSDDQNTLIDENGGVYQATLTKPGFGCDGCEFDESECPTINGNIYGTCDSEQRADGKEVIWVKQENSKMRPHADLIIAWAKGAEIQFFNELTKLWYDDDEPSWSEICAYRVKPKSVPDVIRYMYIGKTPDKDLEVDKNDANIMVVLDGSTGEVKSVQKL